MAADRLITDQAQASGCNSPALLQIQPPPEEPMPLIDEETAERIRARRDPEIAGALANPKILAALEALIEEGVEPSIAHGCMMHLWRQIKQSN